MKTLIVIGAIVGLLALIPVVFMWAFNLFVSPTFGVGQIDYLQGIAAVVLLILFRGNANVSNKD